MSVSQSLACDIYILLGGSSGHGEWDLFINVPFPGRWSCETCVACATTSCWTAGRHFFFPSSVIGQLRSLYSAMVDVVVAPGTACAALRCATQPMPHGISPLADPANTRIGLLHF